MYWTARGVTWIAAAMSSQADRRVRVFIDERDRAAKQWRCSLGDGRRNG
jgi:hypothetical protein